MIIITISHLVDPFVKSILAELWQQYTNDKEAHESCITFDEYVWTHNLVSLGEAAYQAIGEMYGDLDGAINEVMEQCPHNQ